jgi:peptidoglycan-N-acetylglucosamine deacetylase
MVWGYNLLLLVLSTSSLYTIIPDIFLHRLGIGSWKRQYTSGVALTIDDGPNPEVTPDILDILDK